MKMLEGKGLIEDTDMPMKMQIQAMSCAYQALDLYDVLDCKSIAAHIKKVRQLTYNSCISVTFLYYICCSLALICPQSLVLGF